MTAGTTTWSDISDVVAEIYDKSLLVARETSLMPNLVKNLGAKGWMVRTVPIRASVTATSVDEDADVAPQKFGKSALSTFTPSEAGANISLTDRNLESDPDNAKNDASMELGAAIGQKVDEDLAGVFASFTTDKGPGAGGTATLTTVAAAIAVLRTAKAPAPYYVVLHPYQWHRIWEALGHPDPNYAFLGDQANQALRDYFVSGPLVGATWYVDANITPGTAVVGGVFNRLAIGLDVRRPYRLEPERSAKGRKWDLVATMGYAVGLYRGTWGVKYTSDGSEPS